MSATSFEFKSVLSTSIATTELFNKSAPWIAGNHTSTKIDRWGSVFGYHAYRIAPSDQFEQNDVTVTFDGYAEDITWIDAPPGTTNYFYITNYPYDLGVVRFACPTIRQNIKELFSAICVSVGQLFNADNLAAYPINPNVTFYTRESITFEEYLNVTLETLGALLWINDEGEIEFYRKEIPTEISVNTVNSWITLNEQPTIKTITTEDPASVVQVKNPDYNHNSEDGPSYNEYNAIDLSYPHRTVATHSYAEDSEAIIEARRLANLLAVTRRTYSVTINRISPELFIGAIVNIYSPKDRWEENGQGLNALVVGFTQSFKSNKSELIVWR